MIHFHPPAVIPLLFPILSNKCELKQRNKQPTPFLTSTLPYTPSRSSTSALPAFSAYAESTILPSISLHLSHFSFYCFPLCWTSASCSAAPAPPAEPQTLVSRTRLSSHHPVQTNKTVIKYTNPLCRTDFSTSYCTTIGHRFNPGTTPRSPASPSSSPCPSTASSSDRTHSPRFPRDSRSPAPPRSPPPPSTCHPRGSRYRELQLAEKRQALRGGNPDSHALLRQFRRRPRDHARSESRGETPTTAGRRALRGAAAWRPGTSTCRWRSPLERDRCE